MAAGAACVGAVAAVKAASFDDLSSSLSELTPDAKAKLKAALDSGVSRQQAAAEPESGAAGQFYNAEQRNALKGVADQNDASAQEEAASEPQMIRLSVCLASGKSVLSEVSIHPHDLVGKLMGRVIAAMTKEANKHTYNLLSPQSTAEALNEAAQIKDCGLKDGDVVTLVWAGRSFDPKQVYVEKSTGGYLEDVDGDAYDMKYDMELWYGLTKLKSFDDWESECCQLDLSQDRETILSGPLKFSVVDLAAQEKFNFWGCRKHGTCRSTDMANACDRCKGYATKQGGKW